MGSKKVLLGWEQEVGCVKNKKRGLRGFGSLAYCEEGFGQDLVFFYLDHGDHAQGWLFVLLTIRTLFFFVLVFLFWPYLVILGEGRRQQDRETQGHGTRNL